MKLIIAEKPSVARTIAEVIGATNKKNGYLEGNGNYVSWCIGHLVELVEADVYKDQWKKWSYESLPIIPEEWRHSVKKSTKDQYSILESLLNKSDVTEIICATDAGREGELIFRLVYQQARCSKPIQRLWISSMEEKAISDGFRKLRPGTQYENLYQSALCRSKADWLVGINGTRLFTVVHGKTLKVGRVQTPTLAMLVEREEKVNNFIKEKYFITHLLCEGIDAVTTRIDNKIEADRIARACHNGQALVVSVLKEEKKVHPPKLYDLTTLQRDANRLFGYTAKQTLEYTQCLYEKKLLTYPRTDSQYLTEDMATVTNEVIHAIIENIPFAKEISYVPNIESVLNSKKVSDHHAIIPTVEIKKVNLGTVPKTESAILFLVASRLLCATGEKHTFEMTKAVLECKGEKFTTSGKTISHLGWKNIESQFKSTLKIQEENKSADDHESEKAKDIPELIEGMSLKPIKTNVTNHFTAPPKYFTEDMLLAAMESAGSSEVNDEVERKGLGTPATRADIIEKLVKDRFALREKKQIRPTEEGIYLISILPEVVKSPQMTADWENGLTLVAKGEKEGHQFMHEIEAMIRDMIESNLPIQSERKSKVAMEKEKIGQCPKCKCDVYESKINFYCDNKDCDFMLFKNNKYFASMHKEITKTIANDLLSEGVAHVKGLYSVKKERTFDANIKMSVEGQYTSFTMAFEKRGTSSSGAV